MGPVLTSVGDTGERGGRWRGKLTENVLLISHAIVCFRYKGIGIRIEDDILITQKGPVVLTSECPKEIDELENFVGSAAQ